jgi:methionine-rich copper-binding protein CopC
MIAFDAFTASVPTQIELDCCKNQEDPMSIERTLSIIPVCAVLVLGGAGAASAHAHLVRATPAVGGTVQNAPNEVMLRFNEKLENAFSSVAVRDAAGRQIDKGDAHVDKADRATMRISLPPLSPGVYKVEWRALSTDTHKSNGDFTFQVAE